jgi:GNAT superfamily N-acetyltransferase
MDDATVTGSIGARAARHLELAFRAFTVGHGAELGTGYLRWVTREPHPMGNVAIVADPDDMVGALTAAEPLVTRNVPAAVLFPQGVSSAVARSVVAMGFEDQGAMPAMAVDIDRMAATALPPGYAWARVGAGSGGSAWAEALGVGYGLPPGLARRFSPDTLGADMAADARTQYFSIVRDGRTVATSLLHLADGLAGIYCVATVPEERGKGLGAHATAEALRTARRQGYGVGVLQSSPAGHSVYLGLGFADCAAVPMFVRLPH